jgi:hypothetical protein
MRNQLRIVRSGTAAPLRGALLAVGGCVKKSAKRIAGSSGRRGARPQGAGDISSLTLLASRFSKSSTLLRFAMSKKSENFSFPAVSFRHLETPFQKQYRDYYAVVDCRDLPDLRNWRQINVRDPKLRGAVPSAIREGFRDQPDVFVFMNRGLVIAAENVVYDNKTGKITLTLTKPLLHGVLDGGHSYDIIRMESQGLDAPRYVKVEFLTGFSGDDITNVVDARNTSNQVKDESLMNLAGKFNDLKDALHKDALLRRHCLEGVPNG